MLDMLVALARLTLSDPRRAAAALLRAPALHGRGLELALLVVALGVLSAALMNALTPSVGDALVSGLLHNPLLFAVIQFMLLYLSALMIFGIGRLFGGRGGFEGALLLSIWLQFLSVAVQLALLPLAMALPALAQSLALFIYLYFIWLLVAFIAELHGFASLLKVFAGVIGSTFAAAFLVVFLLAFIGISVE